jgi:hypothetical protein
MLRTEKIGHAMAVLYGVRWQGLAENLDHVCRLLWRWAGSGYEKCTGCCSRWTMEVPLTLAGHARRWLYTRSWLNVGYIR